MRQAACRQVRPVCGPCGEPSEHCFEIFIAAEEIGSTWFTMMDHYFQMEAFATAHDPMLEGYTSLGFVAALTKRMQLGLMVIGVTYRSAPEPGSTKNPEMEQRDRVLCHGCRPHEVS